jgi:hypothetical protein
MKHSPQITPADLIRVSGVETSPYKYPFTPGSPETIQSRTRRDDDDKPWVCVRKPTRTRRSLHGQDVTNPPELPVINKLLVIIPECGGKLSTWRTAEQKS